MESKCESIFKYKSFCLITGASKGLGQTIAIEFARNFPKGSCLLLLARSEDGLAKTERSITENSSHVVVKSVPADLSVLNEDSLDKILVQSMSNLNVKAVDFDQAIIIHNAASLGDVSKNMSQQDDTLELSKFWQLNLTSMLTLNAVFLKTFNELAVKHRFVMNISSICALQPFKSWSLYCSAKAARDMLCRALAIEEPSVRVLNYAPGPIDTEMQVEARTKTADDEIREMFAEMHEEGRLLTTEESVGKLIKLMEVNDFDSGAHIDYYDL